MDIFKKVWFSPKIIPSSPVELNPSDNLSKIIPSSSVEYTSDSDLRKIKPSSVLKDSSVSPLMSEHFIDNPNRSIIIRDTIRKEIVKNGNSLINSKCYDEASCEALIRHIQQTKHDCQDYFSKLFDSFDEKENITSKTLCTELSNKQNLLMEILKIKYSKKKGGKTKRKRKIYKKYRKTKKYRK